MKETLTLLLQTKIYFFETQQNATELYFFHVDANDGTKEKNIFI